MPVALVAVNVSMNVPACVGVPDRTPLPLLKVTPVGNDPVIAHVNTDGEPLAVAVNEPGALTVKVVDVALVKVGGVGVCTGVTVTVPDGGPCPTLLLARTEHV